jgi:hypothetical protein
MTVWAKCFVGLIAVALAAAASPAQTKSVVSIVSNGWTVVANGERGELSIQYGKLGLVLSDVRLNIPGDKGLRPLTSWVARKQGQHRVSIRTVQPPAAWRIEARQNTLEISSSVGNAILTARAPASRHRLVARLLDPQGIPVEWRGTDEVAKGYGGSITRHPSCLPRRNPECMYFSLGQVSSLNFHSLFDRNTDIAINFPDETRMLRDHKDPNLLDITMPVPVNTVVRVIPDYYVKTLGVPYYVPFDDTHFPKAPAVWNSWDNYYGAVTEKDIIENADWIAKNLEAYGFRYVVLDDGYDRGKGGVHYWIKNWNKRKFPHGPQWLANHIKAEGLLPGVWLVPNSYAGALRSHPGWYLHYKNGKLVLDYNTPSLDSTNPAVLDFLKREFTILNGWGFEYYKFDGEYAVPQYVPGIDRNRLYDTSLNPLVAYRNRLRLIRETVGPERFIEGCPAGTPLNGIGYFDSYFNGEDMYPSWQGSYTLFSSINENAFLNHILAYVMPGEGVDLGAAMTVEQAAKEKPSQVVAVARTRETPLKGFGTALPEARTLVSYLALTGVVYSLSSVMAELPPERVQLLKMTLPPMPIFPVDLFSRDSYAGWDLFKRTTPDNYIQNYPRVLDLKVNAKAGVYDVVGLTNWRSWKATRELSFRDQLGLDSHSSYVVFDFWGQKLMGVFRHRLKVKIQPHDTRVLLIHPLLNRPQLAGTSRHITGAYSIRRLAWNAAKSTLLGSSRTVSGEDYTLWIYVPAGATPSQVLAETSGQREIRVRHELLGNALKVTFPGQKGPVDWAVKFRMGTVQTAGQ